MSYSVHSGVYEARTETFPTFVEALRVYRFRRAFQLTLEKGSWYSLNLTNDERVDVDSPSGLTEEQWATVLDDGPARGLLNEARGIRYHNLVCGHAAAELGKEQDGARLRKCLVCGHEMREFTL